MTASLSEGHSPYERALGERLRDLHPKTAWYFSTIPAGHVGVGTGTFDTAGTRTRWIRPLFRLTQRAQIAFSGWERDVPFRIENRTIQGRAVATRWFDLPRGSWVMPDWVELTRDGILRNEVGRGLTAVTTFDISVDNGGVRLQTRRIGLRVGKIRVSAPRWLSPKISLTEGWDEALQRHRVAMTIDVPLIGRVYEYGGTFRYAIEEDNQ